MYRSYYNLRYKPFENTPDPDFLFLSNQHQEALSALLYGIKEAKGFILITGSVGTGKTTLIRSFLQKSTSEDIIINIINPKTSFDDVYQQLRKKLSLDDKKDSQLEGIELLSDRLLEFNEQGHRIVILIDEAHLLQENSLEEIRLLSNIEHEKEKLIQIVLIGQNEIYDLLAKERHKSLQQRIVINRQLIPFNEAETSRYIGHRLQIAGSVRSLFTKNAIKFIWNKSNGTPRLINHICDNALLIGYATEAKHINKVIIKEVIMDMGKRTFFSQHINLSNPKAILAVAASIILGIWLISGTPAKDQDIAVLMQTQISHKKTDILPIKNSIVKSPKSTNRFTTNQQTIQKKELLSDIAYREYGTMSETIMDYIQQANNIEDINKIYSGAKIRLPEITLNSLITKTENNHFHIHYASFYSYRTAQLIAKRLKNEGKQVSIKKAIQGINKIYRVYVGDFSNIVSAKAELNNLDFKYLRFLAPQNHSVALN